MADVVVTAKSVRPLLPSQTIIGIAGEAMNHGQVVVPNASNRWVLADASAAATTVGLIGIVVAGGDEDGAVGSGDTITVLVFGRVCGFTGLNPTKLYYLSNTSGAISDTAGTVTRALGYADPEGNGEVFFFMPAVAASS
ncbi:MAG: hypothetical protein QXS68_03150 [Candidatus Methanomethylicaceae archaeon]